MKSIIKVCTILFSVLILFSCSNIASFFNTSEGSGKLVFQIPAAKSARAAVDKEKLEYKITVTNQETNAEQSSTGKPGQNCTFELAGGIYSLKASAYLPEDPEKIIYEGETKDIQIIPGEVTNTKVILVLMNKINPEDEIKLTLNHEVVKVTAPSKECVEYLKSQGCDGYYIGVASGLTPEGWDKWIFGKKVKLTDEDAFTDVDFTNSFLNSYAKFENKQVYPVIDFYKNVDLPDGERGWLSTLTGKTITYSPTTSSNHIAVENVSNGIKVTISKKATDSTWTYNTVKFAENSQDTGCSYSYFSNGECVFTDSLSFVYPFTTKDSFYTFTINPYEGCQETVAIYADNNSDVQLQNLDIVKESLVRFTVSEANTIVTHATIKLKKSVSDIFTTIFTNPDALQYKQLCINTYSLNEPDATWVYNFGHNDAQVSALSNDGIDLITFDDTLGLGKTKEQLITAFNAGTEIKFSPTIQFNIEPYSADTGNFMINTKNCYYTWHNVTGY